MISVISRFRARASRVQSPGIPQFRPKRVQSLHATSRQVECIAAYTPMRDSYVPQGAIDERQLKAKEILAIRSRLPGFPFHAQITQKRLRKLALERPIVFRQQTLP